MLSFNVLRSLVATFFAELASSEYVSEFVKAAAAMAKVLLETNLRLFCILNPRNFSGWRT